MSLEFEQGPGFWATMPARYRELFHGSAVLEHAAIAARRRGAPAHAEIWRRLPQGAAVACLVAEDRPGMHSYLGTVFAARSIDILSAQVFSRATPQGAEVVDFLSIRREEGTTAPLVEADLSQVADLLSGLMTGELRVGGRPLEVRSAPSRYAATLVRFEEGSGTDPATLVLETLERPGLLRTVAAALINARVRILSSARTGGPGARAIHRFAIAEMGGGPPDQCRRGHLQAEVLRVVEPAARLLSPPAQGQRRVIGAGNVPAPARRAH
jgi:UTP:GlnB (protein PII) uridylyltransferase